MKIPFLVSPGSLEVLDDSYFVAVEDLSYRNLMNKRLAVAKENAGK